MPRWRLSRSSSPVTWRQSSRVGTRITAWTQVSSGSTRSTMGSPNAAVFPVPVWACPTQSFPASSGGTQRACTGVGSR